MMSLNRRMLLGASVVLAVFIALTALGLERAFVESARAARQERLLGQLYLLIAAAEVDAQGRIGLPERLAEPRFGLPGSGLFAAAFDQSGQARWRSASVLNEAPPFQNRLAPGVQRFDDGAVYFVQSLGVKWTVGHRSFGFTFSVAETRAEFDAQMQRYRRNLWGWLAGLALLLLLTQAWLLRWGLRPLRAVVGELNAIEAGERDRLRGRYPAEIQRLTDSLNSLLRHERDQRQRYRDALADLAHSLKTPLAVMRGALGGVPGQLPATVDEQVSRMDHIVAYQLQRAATAGSGHRLRSRPLAIAPVVEKIVAALRKVHADKPVRLTAALAPEAQFAMEEGDAMELLGNLLDNAFKWCVGAIRVELHARSDGSVLSVEDDGPGIAPDQVEKILRRGGRADEAVPGHGIGLAVVRDIVAAYQGRLDVDRSALGGATIRVVLPQRPVA